MQKFLTLISIILILLSCQSDNYKKKKIFGLWCNNLNYCSYFSVDKCIFNTAEIRNYYLNDSMIIIPKSNLESTEYYYTLKNDSLILLNRANSNTYKFHQPKTLNSTKLKTLKFTQSSDYNEINFYCDNNLTYNLYIKYANHLQAGQYKGILSEELFEYISSLIQQMKLDLNRKYNPSIISDLQEWATFIESENGDSFKLYYNYLEIDNNHKNFSQCMNLIPHLLQLEESNFKNVFTDLEEYMENNFKENLKILAK